MGARRVGWRLQTILLLVPMLLVLVAGCASPPEDAESRYRMTVRARGLFENGDAAQAAELLQRVAEAHPHAEAYVNLGLVQHARGKSKDAVRAWRTAVDLDPQCVGALYQLAVHLYERASHDRDEARAKPKKAEKLRARAAERGDEARSLLERAAAADAYNASVPRLLATLHEERGDSTRAAAALREAQRLDPERAGADPSVYGLTRITPPRLRRNVRISRTPPRFLAKRTNARATFLELFDVDADAIAELVLGGSGDVLEPDASVREGAAAASLEWLGRDVRALQSGLFNDDRNPDVVVITPARRARRGARYDMYLVRGGTRPARAESLDTIDFDVLDTESLDVDADGDIDLVLAVSEAPGLRVWRNNGRGRFERDAAIPGFEDLAPARAVTSGDLDADGRTDLVWIDASYQVRVLGALESGFVDVTSRSELLGERARAVACADVDADGNLDVLLGDDEGLWLWTNRGTGRFERRAAYRETDSAWSTRVPRGVAVSALYLADLDNDGFQDAITLHFPERKPEFATTVSAPDTDEDTSPASRRLVPLLDVPAVSRLAVWRNEGRGVFGDLAEATGVNGMPLLSTPPRALDLDRDGDLDLACVGPDSVVRVLWNLDAPKSRRLEIQLVDSERPASIQGARVEVYDDKGVRHAVPRGTVAHIGVGTLTGADVLRVVWPDGHVENYFDVRFPESYRLKVTRGRTGSN